MATEQLLLSAVGSSDQWTLIAGSTKVSACQTPDDDATSYIGSGTTPGVIQLFALADPVDIESGDTINSVYLRVRCMRGGTPAPYLQARLVTSGGTLNSGSIQTGASWANTSETFTTKPGGGAWDLTALNELQAGLEMISGNRTGWCTTVEVIVDYTPGGQTVEESIVGGLASPKSLSVLADYALEVSQSLSHIRSLLLSEQLDTSDPLSLVRSMALGASDNLVIETVISESQSRDISLADMMDISYTNDLANALAVGILEEVIGSGPTEDDLGLTWNQMVDLLSEALASGSVNADKALSLIMAGGLVVEERLYEPH